MSGDTCMKCGFLKQDKEALERSLHMVRSHFTNTLLDLKVDIEDGDTDSALETIRKLTEEGE